MDDLNATSDKIPERDIIMHILRGFSLDHKGFVTSMNKRVVEPSLFELQSILLIEEHTILDNFKSDE